MAKYLNVRWFSSTHMHAKKPARQGGREGLYAGRVKLTLPVRRLLPFCCGGER